MDPKEDMEGFRPGKTRELPCFPASTEGKTDPVIQGWKQWGDLNTPRDFQNILGRGGCSMGQGHGCGPCGAQYGMIVWGGVARPGHGGS